MTLNKNVPGGYSAIFNFAKQFRKYEMFFLTISYLVFCRANHFSSNEEYMEMLLIYGKARRNIAEVQIIYQGRFPNRNILHRNTSERVQRRLAGHDFLEPSVPVDNTIYT